MRLAQPSWLKRIISMAGNFQWSEEATLPIAAQIQSMAKLFPMFQCTWDRNIVEWIGRIRPTDISNTYKIKIRYGLKQYPMIWVLEPLLDENFLADSKAHIYPREQNLCLFYPKYNEWTPNMLIAEAIMPWIYKWLVFTKAGLSQGNGGAVAYPTSLLNSQYLHTQGRGMEMFKVLALDGGGVKGTMPAAFLAHLEEGLGGRKISEYFDLIVGTSTGGIIAIGMGLGLSAREILSFYENDGPAIFRQGWLQEKMPKQLQTFIQVLFTKYNQKPLRDALGKRFSNKRLGDSGKRLVIPSINADTGAPYLYKTPHTEHYKSDWKLSAVDIALATSAAPTFFPVHINQDGLPLIDGGMWANNPIMVALIEAHCILGHPLEEIQILSLGCTSTSMNIHYENSNLFSFGLVKKLAAIYGQTQSDSALGMAKVMLGENNIIRVNPIAPEGMFELGDYKKIQRLKALGKEQARFYRPRVEAMFFQKPAQQYIPCPIATAI